MGSHHSDGQRIVKDEVLTLLAVWATPARVADAFPLGAAVVVAVDIVPGRAFGGTVAVVVLLAAYSVRKVKRSLVLLCGRPRVADIEGAVLVVAPNKDDGLVI